MSKSGLKDKAAKAKLGYGTYKAPRLSEKQQKDEVARAWRAVAAARRYAPTFKAFVKTVSGNDVEVIVNPIRTCTDGKVLLIQPPIELGDPGANRHALGLCNEYAADGLSLCGACRIQESLLARVFHEIAHPLFGSMDVPTDEDLHYAARVAGERAAAKEYAPTDPNYEATVQHWTERFRGAIERDRARKNNVKSFMGAASVVSMWLPLLVNLVEDMRVNERLFEYQPGMRRVLGGDIKAGIQDVLEGQRTGEKEFDSEFVAALAMYADAMGWRDLWRSRTDDDALIGLIEDVRIQELLEQGRVAKSVGESFRIGNEMLAIAQGLGFFLDPEPEDDKEDEDEDGCDSDGQSGDGKSGASAKGKPGSSSAGASGAGTPGERADGVGEESDASDSGDRDSDSDDDSGDSDDTEDDGSGSGGGGDEADAGDDAERGLNAAKALLEILGHEDGMDADGVEKMIQGALKEIQEGTADSPLAKAIGQAAWFKGASHKIAGVQVTRLGSGKDQHPRAQNWTERYEGSLAGQSGNRGRDLMFVKSAGTELAGVAAREAGKARLVFAANRAIKTTRNKDHGKIYGPTLGRKLKTGDFKVFGTKDRPDKRDYAVLVGMDISGSTMGAASRNMTLNELIRRCGYVQMELLNKIGVGNTACYAHTGEHFDGGYKVSLYEVKAWNDQWDRQAKARIDALAPASANLDGHTFEAYLKILERVEATDKILLYFTDGAMPAENYEEELRILKETFQRTKRMSNLHILTVGVQNDDPLKYGLDMVRLDAPEDIGRVTAALAGMIK